MRNLELKSRCADLDAVLRRAEALGARDAGVLVQCDVFFSAPGARLKLRALGDGRGELISYRRPDAVEVRASEYRVYETADPSGLTAVLRDALGEAGMVRKRRRLFLYRHTRIHLDEVEGLGTFVELETVMTGLTDEAGRAELDSVAAALALRPEDRVGEAYVDLLRPEGAG
jgi:predicted adenylyl cyclase CyaB